MDPRNLEELFLFDLAVESKSKYKKQSIDTKTLGCKKVFFDEYQFNIH